MATLPIKLAPIALRIHRIGSSQLRADGATIMASFLLAGSITLAAPAFSPRLIHWFLIPLFGCGFLVGIDLIEWLRGRIDLFDPAGMIGILSFHFFFVAPLLMIHWDYRMRYLPEQPDDYRTWLGLMAILNFCGLILYRKAIATMGAKKVNPQLATTRWAIRSQKFWTTWLVLASASVVMEAWMLVRFGGISGYVAAYSAWLQGGGDSFEGAALLFAVSESLPLLLIIAFAFWARRNGTTMWTIIAAFVGFAVLDFLIGGLRGSRSNVIWTIFWGAGIIHLYVRKIPRTLAIASLVILYAFVSIYAAYKQHGSHLLTDFTTSGEYSSLNDGAEDSATVLVGDFSRADVQANLLWKLNDEDRVPYAWGRTYLGALTMLIPRSAWPERPATIVKWSTDAEYGNDAYNAGLTHSTRVYGIAGEAMLNIGPIGVPIALLVLGIGVGYLRRFRGSLDVSDGRVLVLPFFINLGFLLLLNDSDNIVFYLVKYGLVPVTLIVLSCQRITRRVVPCKLSSQPPASATRSFNSTSIAQPRSTSITASRSIASR